MSEESIEVNPKELEFAFAQSARFGAFLLFLGENKDLCRSVFKKHLGQDIDPSEAFHINSDDKKNAIIDLVSAFQSKGSTGHVAQMQISLLFRNKAVWENVEMFCSLCKISRDRDGIK